MQQYRDRIDELDNQVLELLNQRARIALQIAAEKKRLDLPIVDPNRESQVLERLNSKNDGPLPETSINQIYHAVMNAMRSLQREQS